MGKGITVEWSCDACDKRAVMHSTEYPDGWKPIHLGAPEGQNIPRIGIWDLCAQCAQTLTISLKKALHRATKTTGTS